MPACYAHYRYGLQMLEKMPKDVARTVNQFRRLYDVGLHGPDPFFFYNPFVKNAIGELGSKFHRQTGREFFTRVCRAVRMNPSEPAKSYLYGVLCHYCLDSCCHPDINRWDREGPATHTEIEGEFERYLLELDGRSPPHEACITGHVLLTPGEWGVMARFYPGVNPRQAGRSVKNMASLLNFLTLPEGPRRNTVQKTLEKTSKSYAGLLIPVRPNPKCQEKDGILMEHYQQAVELYPVLLAQIQAHLAHNAPLGEEFQRDFG